MAKNKIKITPEMEELMNNFRINHPESDMPPLSWFALSDEERARATDAPVTWRFGILPPDELDRILEDV
ncbi:hypothetical protein [Adlercreutzia agrestimuris]|uniref:hypothetical protein n=1 Tax=Adlercreutzia agrestimuris TaxID=2941324 RepID=UPI00203B26A3|nr:hypothetical protein [Adlercreutzia agrestimuris]